MFKMSGPQWICHPTTRAMKKGRFMRKGVYAGRTSSILRRRWRQKERNNEIRPVTSTRLAARTLRPVQPSSTKCWYKKWRYSTNMAQHSQKWICLVPFRFFLLISYFLSGIAGSILLKRPISCRICLSGCLKRHVDFHYAHRFRSCSLYVTCFD